MIPKAPVIYPVILAGGVGTRLWPVSRKSYPKQFSTLTSDKSLFQNTAKRLSGPGFAAPTVLTHTDFRFIATEQLAAVGIDPGAVLLEPEGRNTAPAILVAALYLAQHNPKGMILVAPSDHVIPDAEAFHTALAQALPGAQAGDVVTFGVPPDRPETGYGYLQLNGPADPDRPALLKQFIEKPDAADAVRLLADGDVLWNAGIFLFSIPTILEAYRQHAPDLCDTVQAALDHAYPDLGFLRLAPEPWAACRAISVDYAIMEKLDRLMVVPLAADWSDLGAWDAVWRAHPQDADGVARMGPAQAIECQDTLLYAQAEGQVVVGVGLENMIVVAMPDAVLVADKSRTQSVGTIVKTLQHEALAQAEQFPQVHRPWGWFESIAQGPRFQVKRIVVHPGSILSLQSHHHRAEHWVVVEGTARVTIDGIVSLIAENQSTYIPLGARHRLENPGKLPLVLIEVQTGAYLGEDDITRYEDVYART